MSTELDPTKKEEFIKSSLYLKSTDYMGQLYRAYESLMIGYKIYERCEDPKYTPVCRAVVEEAVPELAEICKNIEIADLDQLEQFKKTMTHSVDTLIYANKRNDEYKAHILLSTGFDLATKFIHLGLLPIGWNDKVLTITKMG